MRRRTDYTEVVQKLKSALEKDQLFVIKDLLEVTDEGSSNAIVKAFYEEWSVQLAQIRLDIAKTEELLQTLRSTEGWKKCSEKKGTTVYFQKHPGESTVLTKLETVFPAKPHEVVDLFTKIVSIFNETDLMPRWFPRNSMKSCDLIKQITKFSKIVCAKVRMPQLVSLVLAPREAYMLAKGWDLSERSQVVITVTTLNQDDKQLNLPNHPISKGYQPFIFESAFYFELTDNGIIFKMLQSVDLCSKIIPKPVTNYLSKGIFPHEMIRNLKKVISEFHGSVWDDRVKDQPEIYNEIMDRLSIFLEDKLGIELSSEIEDTPPEQNDDRKYSGQSGSLNSSRKRKKGFVGKLVIPIRRPRIRSSHKARKKGRRDSRVDIFDYELSTNNIKQQKAQIEASVRTRRKNRTFLEVVLFYLVMILVKVADFFGQKGRLADTFPSWETKHPQLFN